MKVFGHSLLALTLLIASLSRAQTTTDTISANERIPKTLLKKLKDVKYANMYQGLQWKRQYVDNTASIDSELMVGVAMFLKSHFGFQVAIKEEQLVQLQAASGSNCDFTEVAFTGNFEREAFSNGGIVGFSISFSFCDGSTYTVLLSDYKASREADHYDLIKEQLEQRFR